MVNNKELEPIGGTISVVNLPVAMLTASSMPMRDCMAMAAMQAVFTGAVMDGLTMNQDINCDKAAETAYTMADAMLKARDQK